MTAPAKPAAAPAGTLDTAQLAERLGARCSGRGWIAHCPAHNDRSPSLSIADGRDGRTLLHCFASCSTESILAALGLSMRDLFAAPCASRKPTTPLVQTAERQAGELRSRLTQRERVLPVVIVAAKREHLSFAIARALALAVEGEVVQIILKEELG